MQLTEQRFGTAVVLVAPVRIDHANAGDFNVALQPFLDNCKAGGDVVILDFSAVSYISSIGLRVLMTAAKRARAVQGAIAVAALQPVVAEIFEISRFNQVLSCHADVRAALAACAPDALAVYAASRGKPPTLLVRIWGSRGSLPVALNSKVLQDKLVKALVAAAGKGIDTEAAARAFIADELDFTVAHTFGGNSSCVQIDAGGDEYLICDMGSGARELGNSVFAAHGPDQTHVFHVFMSHLHWDHIMGFPFFAPAYRPGNHICIYGCHETLEEGFRRQHTAPSFPIEFEQLPAMIEFVRLQPGRRYDIAGCTVTALLQEHSGDSYGYRFERDGKSVVYSTDSEHKLDNLDQIEAFVAFFRGADLVIFDAMYSLADAVSVKEDWGHSSNIVGVELCRMAEAKRLCLFHHEPIFNDERLAAIWRETRRLEKITRSGAALEILSAYDGLEILL